MSIMHLSNPAYARHQGWEDSVTGPLGKILRDLEEAGDEAAGETVILDNDREATADLIASIRIRLDELENDVARLDAADDDEQDEEEEDAA